MKFLWKVSNNFFHRYYVVKVVRSATSSKAPFRKHQIVVKSVSHALKAWRWYDILGITAELVSSKLHIIVFLASDLDTCLLYPV